MEVLLLKATGVGVGAILAVGVIAFVKGWVVAGFIYQREVENGRKWEERSLKFLETIKVQSDALQEATRATEAIVNRSSPP